MPPSTTEQLEHLSLAEISKKTRIPEKYLQSFSNKKPITKDAYSTIYLKAYCKYLGLDYANESKTLLIDQQKSTSSSIHQPNNQETPKLRHPKTALRIGEIISIATLSRKLIIAAIVLAIAGYIGSSIYSLAAPPKLTITSPEINTTTRNPFLTVQGITTPEATVTINGKVVPIDSRGTFTDHIDLAQGHNTITVNAQKKYGKPTTIERNVVVTP